MIREADIEAMERIIVDHAGPVGKFVIKKALADLGGNPMSFTPETKERFIEMVLESDKDSVPADARGIKAKEGSQQ